MVILKIHIVGILPLLLLVIVILIKLIELRPKLVLVYLGELWLFPTVFYYCRWAQNRVPRYRLAIRKPKLVKELYVSLD